MRLDFPVATEPGPYLKLDGPETLFFVDGTRVESTEDYLGRHAQIVQRQGIARRWTAEPGAVAARVEHGRWLAICRYCGTGMLTRPDWRIGCCDICGGIYPGIVFPADHETIARLLLSRPHRETQNWEPGESLLRLRAENVLHRVIQRGEERCS